MQYFFLRRQYCFLPECTTESVYKRTQPNMQRSLSLSLSAHYCCMLSTEFVYALAGAGLIELVLATLLAKG